MNLRKQVNAHSYSWVGRGIAGGRAATWGAHDHAGNLRVVLIGEAYGYRDARRYSLAMAGDECRPFTSGMSFTKAKRKAALFCSAP